MNNNYGIKCKRRPEVVVVGTSEKSMGGITSVIKLTKSMPLWDKYGILWLETQVDGHFILKIWCVVKAAMKALFVIPQCRIVHFHIVPGITLFTQLPALMIALLFKKKIVLTIHVGDQLSLYSDNKFFKWWLQKASIVLLLAERWLRLFHDIFPDINYKIYGE